MFHSKLSKPIRLIQNTLRRYQSSLLQSENPQWQQTMLRITDPSKTIPFYEEAFGMKLLHKYDFNDNGFSLYFMVTPNSNINYPQSCTPESEELLWNYPGVTLELTHNHDTNTNTIINNGNIEPYRGFGHIAFNTNDVYKSYDNLIGKDIIFEKAPNEGRMKGLSFALDPDGYWIEIIDRNTCDDIINNEYNLSQTMIRVKDPFISLDFYCNKLGMKQVCEAHFENAKFSVYFLSSHSDSDDIDLNNINKWKYMKESFHPFLELTHNWGTENDNNFMYHNGNNDPQGFGHIGFLVNDLNNTCQLLQNENIKFKKLPTDGKMRGIAFAIDPDGYWIELIQRGVTF